MRIHSTCLLPHDLWGMPALKCYPAIQFDGGSPGALMGHIASIKLNSPVSKTHILRNANQMMKNAATIPINTPKVRIPRLRTVAPSLLFPASKIGNGQNTMDDVEPLFAVRGYLIQ